MPSVRFLCAVPSTVTAYKIYYLLTCKYSHYKLFALFGNAYIYRREKKTNKKLIANKILTYAPYVRMLVVSSVFVTVTSEFHFDSLKLLSVHFNTVIRHTHTFKFYNITSGYVVLHIRNAIAIPGLCKIVAVAVIILCHTDTSDDLLQSRLDIFFF